jgi:hypothetical protein
MSSSFACGKHKPRVPHNCCISPRVNACCEGYRRLLSCIRVSILRKLNRD